MSDALAELLAPYGPEVRELAMKARALVRGTIPEAIEQVDPSAKLIGYGFDRTYAGLVCAVALQKSYVNLMFARGTELADPQGLLEGTGKRARHVKIRKPEDVDTPALRALLEQAATLSRR